MPNAKFNSSLESWYNKLTLFQISSHSKLLSKSYTSSKFCPFLNIQLSITSSSNLQISIVITFWRAMTMMHTPFKTQTILNYCPKVMRCRNLCSLNGRPRVFTISNLHNFCNTTPNWTCEHNLESSQYKEQSPKNSIKKNLCSMSYMQSKSGFKPFLSNLHTHTHSHILRNLFSNFFALSQVEVGTSAHAPYLKPH